MTLIECFSGAPVDNISACLHLKPSKLIFLGKQAEMETTVQRYRDLLTRREMDTVIELVDADPGEMWSLIPTLRNLLSQQKNCVIDLTNGDEPVILAVGAALAGLEKFQRSRISVQKYDAASRSWKDCDGDGWVVPGSPITFTVAELIALHGGTIFETGFIPQPHYAPEFLQPLWEYSCRDAKGWNRAITVMTEFESKADSRTQVFLMLPLISGSMHSFEDKLRQMRALLYDLQECGVVVDESNVNCLQYTYSDPLLRHCTYRQGNLLEAKAFLEARSIRDDQGQPYFQDCQSGVIIDWDGILYDPDDWIPETRNEVDLLLTRNGIPLFVSCKHGNVDEDELYKLCAVAERFGGPYARKMLIATDLDRKSAASEKAFLLRAREMGVYAVTNAAKLTGEEWENAFRAAMAE